MRAGNGRGWIALRKSADYTLDQDFITSYGSVVGTDSELKFTMPSPQSVYDDREVQFVNGATGWSSIICNDGFPDGSDVMLIAPGEEIILQCVKTSTTAYKWVRQGYDNLPKWNTWIPTEAWTTATPTTTVTARYQLTKAGLCHVDIVIYTADGAGATALTLTPPPGAYPQDVDAYIPLYASQSIDSAVPTNPIAFIDCLNNTAASRLITCHGLATLTDDKTCTIRIKGTYPVYGARTYTPTLAATGGTPTSTSIVGLYQIEGNTCYNWVYQVLSDGKNATAATYTPAIPVKDTNQYVSGEGFALVDATYSDPMPYMNATHDTMASRLISFNNLPTLTDTKGCALAVAVVYEMDGWFSYTPTETWGTEPASWASSMRYYVDREARICHVIYTGTSADGNGNAANSLTITLPVVPKYGTNKSLLSGYQIIDTTDNKPAPYIDHSQTTGALRALIRFEDLTLMTDAKTSTVWAAGFFEID